jgi:endonuclease-8
MPEGDTIHAAAASLRRALGRGPVTLFDAPASPGPRPGDGELIEGIEARGKHLLVTFETGVTLHTHLGMTGSWRVAPAGTPPRLPRGPRRSAAVGTARAVGVCREAPVVELLGPDALRRHPELTALGPDLCLPDPDLDAIGTRFHALLPPETPVADALLDQRIAAGIGNVYRSEVLWACRVDPFREIRSVDPEMVRHLYATAGRHLRSNLDGRPRTTVPGGLAVYGRARRPCRRCGVPITATRVGDRARTVWWCPSCQGEPG